jgi:dolichol-phosphate mannosyltransferase
MIAAVVPTLNEEEGIGEVVRQVPDRIDDHDVQVFVLDGGSDDGTCEVAEEAGAKVIEQHYTGAKGSAVRQAFDDINAEYFVMLDGDGSYLPGEMEIVLRPVMEGEADHVIGTRLANREKGALPRLNLLGNLFFNRLVSLVYGREIRDMLSGYRAFSDDFVSKIALVSDGFGIETEMTILTVDSDARLEQVPVTYRKRKGHSKLHPFSDGWKIFRTIVSLVKDTRPFSFHTWMGVGAVLAAFLSVGLASVAQSSWLSFMSLIFAFVLLFSAVLFVVSAFLASQAKNNHKRMRTAEADGSWI